jgi:hypothetical protein
MSKAALVKALIKHFGHREWTLIDGDKVQLDGSEDVVAVADLGIDILLADSQHQIDTIQTEARRKAAYIAEADPLFFKAQRGEATLQEWQDKVAEIKARYPKPVQPDPNAG